MRRCTGPDGRATGSRHRLCRGSLLVLVTALAGGPAAAQEDANILETRTRVAGMAEETIDMLKSELTMEGVEGWAVLSGDSMPPDLGAGIGMAESIEGETWFLRTPRPACLSKGHRHVLIFRDEDAFREFRQGRLQGDALERMRSEATDAKLMAYRFRPAAPPELQPLELGGCRFALHRDLQRALVGEPSETEGLVDDKHVDVDDD